MQENILSNWASRTMSVKRKLVYGSAIVLMLPLVYWFVYATGGIKYVYSHSMYIPIILAGVFFGLKGGLLVGIVAGIILGPLMPISTLTNDPQPLVNWLFRLLIFAGTGALSGYGVDHIRKKGETIRSMILYNAETGIPNTNAMRALCNDLPKGSKTVATVLISNHQDVIDALGTDTYNEIFHALYQELKDAHSNVYAVVQSDTHKLWLVKGHTELDKDAQEILDVINHNRFTGDTPIYLDVSIGATIINDEQACDTLETYRLSDSLAREAQKKNLPYAIKDKDMDRKIKNYDLVSRFSESFYKQELSLDFQTQIDLKTGKPFAIEALLRWKHPKLGSVSPGEFIPLIEETKLIHHLTRWVMENAFEAVNVLKSHNIDIAMSINISAKNLYDPEFYERIEKLIDTKNINPKALIFEITESALMADPEKSHDVLTNFSDKGIKIAIDDFGAGYSSLAYLSRFPIDIIKIDKYFISQLTKETSIVRIVKSTINLAHELGYEVIAEGVENQESDRLIKDLNGTFAQGFYYSHPVSLEALLESLKTE